jgi:tetratricopeptide (TPR) repeat protein
VKEDPENWRYKDVLSNASSTLAMHLKRGGRLQEARQAYQEALDTQEHLVKRFPGDAGLQRDLANTYRNLGPLFRALKEYPQAQEMFTRGEAIAGKLARDFPDVPQHHHIQGAIYHNWALLRFDLGHPDEALTLFEKAAACQRTALRPDPKNFSYRQSVCADCYQIAAIHLNRGNHEAASRAAADMPAAASGRTMDFIAAAGLFARCARLAEQDPRLSSARREEVAREYEAQAVRVMRTLLGDGPQPRPVAWIPPFAEFLSQEDFERFLREARTKPPGK